MEIVTRDEGAQLDAKTGKNDNGCAELDVLNILRSWGIAGRKIEAYAPIDPKLPDVLKAAVALFGGAYVGVELPNIARDQDVWTVADPKLRRDDAPGTLGRLQHHHHWLRH